MTFTLTFTLSLTLFLYSYCYHPTVTENCALTLKANTERLCPWLSDPDWYWTYMDLVMDIDIRIYSGVLMHAYLMRTVHAGGHFHSAGLYVPRAF